MQRTTLSGMILGLSLFLFSGLLVGSEVDELRERSKALKKKASILSEQGKQEDAQRLEQESVKLREAAERMEQKANGRAENEERPGIDKVVHQLKERLQDLRAQEQKMREGKAPEQELAEVREQISGTERQLKQIHARQSEPGELRPEFREQAEKLQIASRRIHHMRVAAQNLQMAEMHDVAHKIMEQAEAMERDVQNAKRQLEAEMHRGHERHGEHGPDVVHELKQEIERLRAEVKELSQKVEKR
jgi:DNA repair exonuclease SbcCD ATPase subunit